MSDALYRQTASVARKQMFWSMANAKQTYTRWQFQFFYHFYSQPLSVNQGQKIYWIWSSEGSTGKSRLYKSFKGLGAFCLTMSDGSEGKHWSNLYKNEFLGVLDASKSERIGSRALYAALESFQQDIVIRRKYAAKSSHKPPTPIVIVANQAPWYFKYSEATELFSQTISLARWEVYKLVKTTKEVTFPEAKKPTTMDEYFTFRNEEPVQSRIQSRKLVAGYSLSLIQSPRPKDWDYLQGKVLPNYVKSFTKNREGLAALNWYKFFNTQFKPYSKQKYPTLIRGGDLFDRCKELGPEHAFSFDIMAAYVEWLSCTWIYRNRYDEWLCGDEQLKLSDRIQKLEKKAKIIIDLEKELAKEEEDTPQ